MPTKILPCTCKFEQQDRFYGFGRRVMNKTASKVADIYRCTVCEKLHTVKEKGDKK